MHIVMKTSDAVKAFKSKAKVASAIGISKQAVSQWGDTVPEASALKLLRVDPTISHSQENPKASA
ncbi:Cro/CI family transcriptional regulator [Acinetobacter indicus]|uniref:Cro/CI family transcriptional regulator n=1 Tax=Acinetobacter indicus TaxID=756892 RepID=UPI0039897229